MAKSIAKEWLEGDKLILLSGWARDGLTMDQIAHNCGIKRQTLYEWMNKYPDIADVLKRTREVVDYEVENALYKNAMEGNVTAQIFWLKNRKKNEWRERVEIPTSPQELSKVEELLNKIKDEANNDTK